MKEDKFECLKYFGSTSSENLEGFFILNEFYSTPQVMYYGG